MHDQVSPGACDDGMKSEKRTRNRKRNPRVTSLLAEYQTEQSKAGEMWCPECYTLDDECLVNPSYDGDLAYCPDEVGHPDAVADCIATYTYVDLRAGGDQPQAWCAAERSCLPDVYDGVDEILDYSSCTGPRCNDEAWLPWTCTNQCGDEWTECVRVCDGEAACQSTCMREFDQCLSKCH